jgi:hypothetical protein
VVNGRSLPPSDSTGTPGAANVSMSSCHVVVRHILVAEIERSVTDPAELVGVAADAIVGVSSFLHTVCCCFLPDKPL